MRKHSSYIDKKMNFILKNHSLSDEMIEFYKKLYSAQEKTYESLPAELKDLLPVNDNSTPFLDVESIKLTAGVTSELTALLEEIVSIAGESNPGMDFSHMVKSFSGIAEEALVNFLRQDYDYFESLASEYRLDLSELIFMIHNVYKPLVVKARISAGLSVDKEDWIEGECPFCGYIPDFSKIVESKESIRKLHCSLCEEEWEFPRMKCHSCGNDEQATLGFFEYEDDSDYRVYYCDKCRNYIKCIRIPKLKEESGYDLAVEDVVTGFLDATMISKNYNRN